MSQADPASEAPVSNVARAIAASCAELEKLAEAERLDMLAYLLGMARLEAQDVERKRTGLPHSPSE